MTINKRTSYFLAGVVFIAGIAFCGFILSRIFVEIKNMDRGFIRFLAPGTQAITLDKPGEYTVYFESKSELDGQVYISNDNGAAGLKLGIKEAATEENIRVSIAGSKSTYSLGSREGTSLMAFCIERPGVYEVDAQFPSTGWGEHQKIVLAIGQGLVPGIFMLIGLIFSFVITLIVTIAIPTVIIVINVTKRS